MNIGFVVLALFVGAMGYWMEFAALERGWLYIRFNHFEDLISTLFDLFLASLNVWNAQRLIVGVIRLSHPLPRRSEAVRLDASRDYSGYQDGIDAHRKRPR